MIIITDAFMYKLHFTAVNASFTSLYCCQVVQSTAMHCHVCSETTTYQPYFSANPGKVYSSFLSLEVAGFF